MCGLILNQDREVFHRMAVCTFYSGFKVWISVEHCHLTFPVKLMSPVRNHFLQISRIEAIVEAAVFQRISVSCSVDALMKVLFNKSTSVIQIIN